MSKNKNLKNLDIFKLTTKSGIKPINDLKITTFNNINYFANAKKFDINKLKGMKPEYKQLCQDLIHKKTKSESEKISRNMQKNNDRLYYKLNSFLDNTTMNKDSRIILRLNNLKCKILKNKNNSYFSVNKNFEKHFEDNIILKDFQNNSFLAYKSFKNYSKRRFHKNINIKNNFVNNSNNKLL